MNLQPSTSAHCRKPQILEAFNEDLFWLLLKKERYGRQSWTTLLKLCMTPVGINSLPQSSRFQKFYMFDAHSGFKDESEIKTCAAAWNRATASCRPAQASPLTDSEVCTVEHLRLCLRVGSVFSVKVEPGPFHGTPIRSDAIVAYLQEPPHPMPSMHDIHANKDSMKFYEVVHTSASKRVLAMVAAEKKATSSTITVREFRVLGLGESGDYLEVDPGPHHTQLLDLRDWTSTDGFKHAMDTILLWRSISMSNTLVMKNQVDACSAASSSHMHVIQDVDAAMEGPLPEPAEGSLLTLIPVNIYQ